MTDTQANDFLPDGYELPQSIGNYVKLTQGVTRLRILAKPVIWWLDWKEENWKKKALHYKPDNKPIVAEDKNWLKEFRSIPVWNYELWRIQIWEITQNSIKKSIFELKSDEDYKDIFSYDLKVTKTGEKMETKYSILPGKATPLEKHIWEAYFTSAPNLEKIFLGKDPFEA